MDGTLTMRPLRAITLDYWDTIYAGASVPVRVERRREAVGELLAALESPVTADELDRVYRASAVEADRWWRDEHRGYTTADRIRWLLQQLEIDRPADCAHVARAVQVVDDTLLEYPPPLFDGAREVLAALAERYTLAIVSDTGFASGRAQDRLLERDGIRDLFAVTVYSMDVGHAKPRPQPFLAALLSLGVAPAEALHVGDNERTDVAGALDVGMRAVRLDVLRDGGASRGERVVGTLGALGEYLLQLQ